MGGRVYADHAATSFPKAPGVAEAISRAATSLYSPGRGGYRESIEAAASVAACRRRLAKLVGASRDEELVLTAGATDSLNLVIKGVCREALRRGKQPQRTLLVSMAAEGVRHTLVEPRGWYLDPADIAAAIGPHTCMVVLNHVSNVTGAIQPAAEIGAICRERGVFFFVDAAQSAGHLPLSVSALGVDAMAMAGHKGLLGPQGIGALYVRAGREGLIGAWRDGGTGSRSEEPRQPDQMPMRFESGTMNLLGSVGLEAGLAYVQDVAGGVEAIERHERSLTERFLASGVQKAFELWGPDGADGRTAVFSLRHEAMEPAEVAAVLEAEFGVLSRAGLACAPRVWGQAGATGAVRVSFGATSTVEDVDQVASALRAIGGLA
ncbi:MAG: aminotransferase class V-fold PLP-dependent enzyme [Planctomycetota bacterium]|nr:aminotransferase class V-fold PLP-dependent enzyme [Planctomycetota bacterium]